MTASMTPVAFPADAALAARGLAVGYRGFRRPRVEVLRDLDVTLQRGEFVCLLGANGTGKSTLLRTLTGIQAPLAGAVALGGTPLRRLRRRDRARRLGVVLTGAVDAGVLSAYAVVALGRYPHTDWRGRLDAADRDAVRRAIDAVDARHLAARPLHELSDGERQRVLIARALAQEPEALILDEPTAFLDVPSRVAITGLLRRLAHEQGLGVLLATHDLELALQTADRVWLIRANGAPGAGRVTEGAPEDLVLQGAIGDAFSGPQVRFDAAARVFRVSGAGRGRAAVEGAGLPAALARATLTRCGYEIVEGLEGPPDPAVDVRVRVCTGLPGSPRWEVVRGGRTETLASLEAVAAAVGDGLAVALAADPSRDLSSRQE